MKFAASDGFLGALRQRVDQYFHATGYAQHDCPQMYLKTALILAWFVAAYVLLVFIAEVWWLALPLAVLLGLSMAAIGFNIVHDGGHRAYSGRRWINKLTALSLDLLGGSSYVWSKSHNLIHHSYANITGHDEDLSVGFFARVSPHQPRRWIHRWQQLYLWVFYGFLPIRWQVYADARAILTGRIGECRFARPKGWDLAVFVAGKATFFSLALLVPLLLHPLWIVLLFYLAVTFVQGLVLSVIFQLAHCVEDAAFPLPSQETGRMEADWAVHQVATTVNFARSNRLLTWFVGGLNFQIEHHLFPQICHVHYPALAPLVEATCAEYGVRYMAHETFRAGLASHYRWLRRLGKADDAWNC